jgi:tetratricopeptide (TPR) repeat protein
LLAARLGELRVAAEPRAVRELAVLCARLPLALAVAAVRAASSPGLALTSLTEQLRDMRGRLDVLDAEDPANTVRAVFSWSYRNLDTETARAFRLAGLHPGADFAPSAVAALTADTVEQAGRVLDALARAHLVQPAGLGRDGVHDLRRAYGRELAATHDGDDGQRAALTGLCDYYLAAAAAAMDALYPAEKHRRPQPPAPARPVPPVPAPAAARDWLDAERACLVAVAAHTTANGWPGHAVVLAQILYRYLENGGHLPDAQVVFAAAQDAAQLTGDLAVQAESLKNLGVLDTWHGNYREAAAKLGSALGLYRQLGDRLGQARTLSNLGGIVDFRQGHLEQAISQLRQAVALFRDIGDRFGESIALTNLGIAETRQGHYEQAAGHHRESLAIVRDIGDRHNAANVLDNLGGVLWRQGRYREAGNHLGRALAIFREFGDRRGEAFASNNLGHVRGGQARFQQAAGFHRQALAILSELGDRSGEAEARNSLGEALSGAGLPEQARTEHHGALAVARHIGDKYEQARAHNGLANASYATGDRHQAWYDWQQALALYTDLGTPEAGQVRAQLTATQDAEHDEPHRPARRSG